MGLPYLESCTATPERGDYYLGPDVAPAESPGRWLSSTEALGRVGVEPGEVKPDDLRALMEGRSPSSDPDDPVWLRTTGADGTRAGGLDVTFSPPKPVSVAWAIGDPWERGGAEAVAGAVDWINPSPTGELTKQVRVVPLNHLGGVTHLHGDLERVPACLHEQAGEAVAQRVRRGLPDASRFRQLR